MSRRIHTLNATDTHRTTRRCGQTADYGRCGQRSCDPGLHAHIGYYCVSGVHIGGHGAQLGGALAHSASISCPHSYPLFYEALGLDQGHRFLEVGLGSGYGAALARELAGPAGLVVSVETDPAASALAEAGQRSLPGLMRLSCNSTRTWAAEGPIRSPALPAGVPRAGGEGVCTENAWPQR